MKPFFTVLINAYNYGPYIDQAVRSALDQTIANDLFEVLVIDDGSTDDTRERVARFGGTVRYYFQKNAGQAAAFNAGAALAKGEFIAFLDADDYFVPDKLQRVKQFIDLNPEVDLLFHPLIQADEAGNFLGVHPRSYRNQVVVKPLKMFFEDLLPEPAPTSGGVIRRTLLQKLLPIPLAYRICADSYLQNTVPLIVSAIGYLSDPLAYYRLHSSNHFTCFDKEAGRYVSKNTEILYHKLVLDLKSIEDISIRFNVDVGTFLNINRFRLVVQKAVCVRERDGVIKGLHYVYQNLDSVNSLPMIERVYRLLGIAFRLICGPDLFTMVACRFVDSLPHRLFYRVCLGQRSGSL